MTHGTAQGADILQDSKAHRRQAHTGQKNLHNATRSEEIKPCQDCMQHQTLYVKVKTTVKKCTF